MKHFLWTIKFTSPLILIAFIIAHMSLVGSAALELEVNAEDPLMPDVVSVAILVFGAIALWWSNTDDYDEDTFSGKMQYWTKILTAFMSLIGVVALILQLIFWKSMGGFEWRSAVIVGTMIPVMLSAWTGKRRQKSSTSNRVFINPE